MSHEPQVRPTIRTQAQLEQVWRSQVSPPTDGEHRLWFLRLDHERRVVPVILEITGAVDPPDADDESAGGLLVLLQQLVAHHTGASVAVLRSRPGRGVRAEDRAWAHALRAAAREAGVPLEVVHLLTDAGLTPLPLDEIGLRPVG